MIHVGTCGYSYADWKGPFYPTTIRAQAMLEYYAQTFTAVEIDATYYRVPARATFAAMARRTPAAFRFCAKLPGSATHVSDESPAPVNADIDDLRRNLEPLVDAGKFGAALMQFPNAFHPTAAAHEHIADLRARLPDLPLVAEFRHRDWQTHATLEFLRELGIGWTNLDMPALETLLHPSADATAAVAYVRFHGRNAARWWRGDNVTRFDYAYTAGELGPWADRLFDLTANPDVREVFAFFNNHRRGNAALNARQFEALLEARFPTAVARVRGAPPARQLGFEL